MNLSALKVLPRWDFLGYSQTTQHSQALVVKTMSVQDAKKILTGGDDSVTQFFRAKTAGPLAVKFLPIVKQATDRVGLAQNMISSPDRERSWV